MKKFIPVLLFVLLQNTLYSQYSHSFQSEKKCSHNKANFYSNSNAKQSALMNKYDVTFYKLDIKVERTSVYVEGNVTINAKVVASQIDTFVFELKDYFTIDSVKINNQLKSVSRIGDEVFVGINPLNTGANISAQIFYHGMPNNTGAFFNGISNKVSANWGNQITYTLSEPFAAKEWFPVKQSLTDKADSAYIFVTTSNDNKVGSQGLLTATVPLPNNKVRYEWKTNYPIDYYLISIAVGKYVDYSIYAHPVGIQDSVLIQNYIYDNPATLPYFKTEIDKTVDFMELYSDLFGIYPFYKEKYGHCLVPLGGGMEHQTMTTMGDFHFYLTSHEIAHQWFGDNVTCATWSDIWINEGFASYAEYLAAQSIWSQQEAQSHMLDFHSNIMSLPDGSVYIPPYQAITSGRIFDGRLSYKKGAAIIHNLRFELQNDTVFFNILRTFQQRFKDSTATGVDFKIVAEELSGKDFTDFFDQWYFGEGFPTYNIVYWQYNDTLFLNTTQITSSTITPLFKMLMEYKIQSSVGDTIIKLYHTSNVETFKIPLHRTVSGIVVDPDNWVINGNGSIMNIGNVAEKINFSIFPNPCTDDLKIYLNNSKNYVLSVFDITGKMILTRENFLNKNFKLKTDQLEKGVYFIQISDGINKAVQKFIKN